jgi:hypothetical protein
MASPTAAAGPGRINGLSRTRLVRSRGPHLSSTAHAPLLALGSGTYGMALLFPLLLKEATWAAYAAAFLGTGLLLVGLHLRWTRVPSR